MASTTTITPGTEVAEFTAKEVAAHREVTDCWIVIHGEVYNVTQYIHDHPGGADVLIESAGVDASEAFDNAGHSEDAFDIMKSYRIGKLKNAAKRSAPKPVRISPAAPKKSVTKKTNVAPKVAGAAAVVVVGAAFGMHYLAQYLSPRSLAALSKIVGPSSTSARSGSKGMGFFEGFILASTIVAVAGTVISRKLSRLLEFSDGFVKYPPHIKIPRTAKPDPLLQRGWLDEREFHSLALTEKELISPNTYRLTFTLPPSHPILGLPIGQHVSIKAEIDGKTVQRSYTPVSNNADKGTLQLVIKCYPDGLLTGRYIQHVSVGDEVHFRGPKGAMRYHRGLCKNIGMIAGGTGITPMYQLIRAICEDDRDLTEVSLIYANRTEQDILLREEIDSFARRYPKNLKVYYVLDNPPEGWQGGAGYVTREMIADRLPGPNVDTKIMICGPPPMVNASKKTLVGLGFRQPAALSKMGDQVFCF